MYGAIYLEGPSSVREKRNIGIKESKGNYVFFIDSDCTASEDIFEQHLAVLNQVGYYGCVGVTKFIGRDNYIWKIISETKFLDSFKFPLLLKGKLDFAPWGPCTNLSVRKAALDSVGGFETKLPFKLGADDADLGLRLNKAGYKLGLSELAIVYHSKETWSSYMKITSRVFRWGRMEYFLYYQRHLDQTFLTLPKPITYFFLLLILGVVSAISFAPFYLTIPFIWLTGYLITFSIIKKTHWRLKSNLLVILGAETLHLLFDLGCSIESILHFNFNVFCREPVDDPRNIWHNKLHETWAFFSSLFITFLSISLLWLAFR